MKNLNEWLAKGLHKNVGAGYRYHPQTIEELIININEIVAGGDTDLNVIDTSKIKSMHHLFYKHSGGVSDEVLENINELEFSNWDMSNVTDMTCMFRACEDFTGQNLEGLDTSHVRNMEGVFMDCTSFTGAGLTSWDTSSVDNMSHMFMGCTSFDGRPIENWDVQKVKSAVEMFQNCTSFNANLSKWDVTALTNCNEMFDGCIKFEGKGIDKWQPAWISQGGSMFRDCKPFDADFSGWNMNKLRYASDMFKGCTSFTGRGLDKWEPINLLKAAGMFRNCKSLEIDLSGWNDNLTGSDYASGSGVFTGATRMLRKPEYIPDKMKK